MSRSLAAAPCATPAAVLWFQLGAKRLSGFKPDGSIPAVRDPRLLLPGKHLAVELDGGSDFEPVAQAYDERRTLYLCRRGINLLRFTNHMELRELDAALDQIARALIGGPSP
jgi:very-short-patch-repair endonuclease